MSDSVDWLMRLRRAFGCPEPARLDGAVRVGSLPRLDFTFGAPVPGAYMPDLERAGCILFWGYNPSVARLVHATQTVAALAAGRAWWSWIRGDAGLAHRADPWLRVRPGTDAALALSLAHVMIERGWFDADFVRRWTNATHLVRADTGRLLRASDLSPAGDPAAFVAWDEVGRQPVAYLPSRGWGGFDRRRGSRCAAPSRSRRRPVRSTCHPAFELVARQCAAIRPHVAEGLTGVPAADIERAARTLWESRPVAFYTWSGAGAAQRHHPDHPRHQPALRADRQLRRAGRQRALPERADQRRSTARSCWPRSSGRRRWGSTQRPLGPARFEFVTGEDVWTAALDGRPYRARGLVNFGANLVMAHGDSRRGAGRARTLDFFVHADLFMSPTAELADVVLPVTSAFEHEALRVGFEVDEEAQSLVQLRRPLVAPRGEARSDLEIIFALATRLGLGEHFWDGDLDAAWRHQLARAASRWSSSGPHRRACGCRSRPAPQARRAGWRRRAPWLPHARPQVIELYSETLLDHGYPPLPDVRRAGHQPALPPRPRPALPADPHLREVAALLRDPAPQPAQPAPSRPRPRGRAAPDGRRRPRHRRGRLGAHRVAAGRRPRPRQAQRVPRPRASSAASTAGGRPAPTSTSPATPPYGPDSANLNLILPQTPSDPISGSSPLRASLCEVTRDPGT